MPSLSSSPRMRSAPQRGLCAAISRIRVARGVGGCPGRRERRRQNARNPARCQRRMVAGWMKDCVTPSWRHSCREDNHEALPGSPPNTTGELPLCDDKLLTKKRVLRDQFYAAANEIRGHPGNEPKKVDHVSVLHRLRADGVCSQDGWLDQLREAYYFGEDFKVRTDVDAIAKRVTAANLKKRARRFLDANN